MKMPFLTIFLLFIFALTIRIHYSKKREGDRMKEFWERESLANATRMKDISQLNYILIPYEKLPIHTDIDDGILQENLRILMELKDSKILNLTGYSNTDLKLEYGAPNITRLTEYDLNYTNLVRSLSKIGECYLSHNLREDALTILEYGISIDTDVKLNYELLVKIYSEEKRYDKIDSLKETASNLNSLSKAPILRLIDNSLPV